ncbi:MAG: 16S rRNA (guanine(527)-N(7))-methyltransferase RsmG [Armatimonadetes bacterium]|nr:16S rRNA (guanine(527)-N(7))-methyltransferase RsmG [Armatimonadota bacterium]
MGAPWHRKVPLRSSSYSIRMDSAEDRQFRAAIIAGAGELGVAVTEAELDAYTAHFTLLLARRPAADLTSLTDPTGIAIKHFLDSLVCLLVQEIAAGEHIADIGSGGGFPGLVLAVARPKAGYTLIESNQKRAYFLEEVVHALHLDNVGVVRARAEDAGRDSLHREVYDLTLSRAVAPLPVSLEYCLPLTRVGGKCLAMKGPQVDREIERSAHALAELRARIIETQELSLPQGMGARTLLLIQKEAPTPERYPRRRGIPAKRPL